MIAGVTALGLHLGGAALALANLRGDDGDEGLGAANAEYAVELASPKVPDEALPPGSDTASQAVQAMAQQKAEIKDTELPRLSRWRRGPGSHRHRGQQQESRKRRMPRSPRSRPTRRSPGGSRRPRADAADDAARESDTAKAPNPGIGKDRLGLTAKWAKKISAYFELHKKYPEEQEQGHQVKVSLVLKPPRQCLVSRCDGILGIPCSTTRRSR